MKQQNKPNALTDNLAYQAVFQTLDSAIFVLDMSDCIVYSNPVARTLLGLADDAIMGQSLTQIIKQQFQTQLDFAKLPQQSLAFKVDGVTHYYEIKHHSITGDTGVILGHTIILTDITIQQQALIEVDKMRGLFNEYAHTVGHDVKSPLGVAIGYANMLQAELKDDTEARFFADEIFDSTMRILRICNELVLLAGLRHLKDVERSTIEMKWIVEDVIRRFKGEIEEENIKVLVPDIFEPAHAYTPWVEEIMANYISNAMKYGGTTIELGSDKVNDGMVRYWVKDNGQGVSPEQQAVIFDKAIDYTTVRAEGYGLGLSVVKHIVEKLGGTAGVDSVVGQGATFHFTLPASTDSKI